MTSAKIEFNQYERRLIEISIEIKNATNRPATGIMPVQAISHGKLLQCFSIKSLEVMSFLPK